MTEEHTDVPVEHADSKPVRTGHAAVDEVLVGLDGLDEADVAAHVAVFERAHEQLRGALDRPHG